MASRTRFFFKWAGWSYDPKTQTPLQGRWAGAKALANAEARGQALEFTFQWEHDDFPWDGDGEPPKEVLVCICLDKRGAVLASTSGIADPSREYGQVIEAELACDALASIESSVMEAI